MSAAGLVVLLLAHDENPSRIAGAWNASGYMRDRRIEISHEGLVNGKPCAAICIEGSRHKCGAHGIRVKMHGGGILEIPHHLLRVTHIATHNYLLEENPHLKAT